MTTDVISTLRTTEEYLRAVQLSYNPVALAISRQIKHDMTNDVKVVFKRLDVERDNIIAQNLTMGQTEVASIKANETPKVFNKYVKGAKLPSQCITSTLTVSLSWCQKSSAATR